MKQRHIEIKTVINRFKRIEGQTRGIIRMIEEGKTWDELIIQIASVKSSLNKTAQYILEEHLRYCIIDGVHKGKTNETVKKLSQAMDQFLSLL